MAIAAEGGRLDWDLLVAQAREARISTPVRRSLALAGALCCAEVPAWVGSALRRLRPGSLLSAGLLRQRGVVRPRLHLLARPYLSVPLLTSVAPARRRRAARRPQ